MAKTWARSRALSLLLAVVLATGCDVAVAQEQPRPGGTLVFAVNADPPSYDCINTTTFVAMQTLRPHYSTLLKFDPDKYPEVRVTWPSRGRWRRTD